MEDDTRPITQAFIKAKILNPLLVARTGAEAIAYLKAADKYADRTRYPLPSLVLLDIKLPGVDGFDVLTWIRGESGVQVLRVDRWNARNMRLK
jgi:DNA-binding response OmpR family regulator